MLWAALLSIVLPRKELIFLLSEVAKSAIKFKESPEVYPQHSDLSNISSHQFDMMFKNILLDERHLDALSPLLLLDCMPDNFHWKRYLNIVNEEAAWSSLASAVSVCMNRFSRAAIDIRWLRVCFLALQGRLVFPVKFSNQVSVIIEYPNIEVPDDKIDALISSMEGMTVHRSVNSGKAEWVNQFWKECLDKTICSYADRTASERKVDYERVKTEWVLIYQKLVQHFHETLSTTSVDARHDGVFGIGLYAMNLVVELMRPNSNRPSGRHLLRSLVEVFINLSYLLKKDTEEFWMAFRNYGNGQAKRAFLKLIEEEETKLPSYIDIELLEALCNEDHWLEYTSIDIGHWVDLNLRKMAEDADVKDIYDRYYIWLSGFVHGHWTAIRGTAFTTCLNPLHRYHRIPALVRADLDDVCPDAIDLMNLVLDLVGRAYPGLSERFSSINDVAQPEASQKPF